MSISNQTEIEWLDANIPRSMRFDDTYYTKTDGRAETSHVFINGNNLPERWRIMPQCTISELGFGTGLNFLETARQWLKIKPAGARLHFNSYEQYPLSANDMARALSRWSALDKLAARLCANWQSDGSEFNLQLCDGVKLTVKFGDANTTLPASTNEFDAWYLDGFSPAKNPEMWHEQLLRNVFASTTPGGTFATYSVAGFVRRNLTRAGFAVSRVKGFDTKREMLSGYKPRTGEKLGKIP